MMMNTAIGKGMAIRMLTGRWFMALVMISVGFVYPYIVELHARREAQRKAFLKQLLKD
jgi:hypothetical protein